MLQICLGLSYIFVIGWTCIGVPTVVLPREVSLFTKDAAAVMAGMSVCFCLAAMSAPLVGVLIDRSKSGHRWFKIANGVSTTIGGVLVWTAVHVRGTAGLPLLLSGTLLINMPMIALAGTLYLSLTGVFIARRPSAANAISAIAALFMLVGTSSCTSLVGFVLPIGSKPNEHGFYHVLIGVLLVGDLLLACVETNYELPKKTTPLADADVMVTVAEATDDSESDVSIQQPHAPPDEAMDGSSGEETLLEAMVPCMACCSRGGLYSALRVIRTMAVGREYRSFRLVAIAKMLFQAGTQLIGLNELYIIEDLLGYHDDKAQTVLGHLALANMLGCLIVAVPAGLVADRIGMVPCVLFATILIGSLLMVSPFLSSELGYSILLPFTGVAEQTYGVVDYALIVATMPSSMHINRDTGLFNAVGALGPLLGSTYNGWVLSMMAPASAEPGSGGESLRPAYSREAYMLCFCPLAVLVLLSSVLVCCARCEMVRARKEGRAVGVI